MQKFDIENLKLQVINEQEIEFGGFSSEEDERPSSSGNVATARKFLRKGDGAAQKRKQKLKKEKQEKKERNSKMRAQRKSPNLS